ncbi:phage protein [Enterobacter ludwigii]|uniref:phage protein n=1 Tax=Enterobacter ludwigii TaxID=299767 RepID=UPI003F71FE3D
MSRRYSGMDFDIMVAGLSIFVSKATLDITDNTAVAQTRGIPNGWVAGDVSAEVDLELDTQNFKLLGESAQRSGSWRGIEPFDVMFFAQPEPGDQMKVEAFGCKLLPNNLLDIDSKGGEKVIHKVKLLVTSSDFVHINGVPYLSQTDTRDLLG